MRESDRRRTLRSVLVEESTIAIPDELERAFRAHHGLVFRTAYRITGNAADAEDVLQTVFLRLARRGANADVVEDDESYLRRAAINAALDVMRWQQANPTVELPDLSDEMAARHAGDLMPELRQALGRALAQLDLLLARKDVDPKRLAYGCNTKMGQAGGGCPHVSDTGLDEVG